MSSNFQGGAVAQQLGALRQLMQSLPPPSRPLVHQFWTGVRSALTSLGGEVQQLRDDLSRATAGASVQRPDTSQSVLAMRNQVDQVLQSEEEAVTEASDTVKKICTLPQGWALNYLKKIYSSQQNELDCWVSTHAQAHSTGYVKINLRNTPHPDPSVGGTIDAQPFLHQLAVVAKGQGARLRLTTPRKDGETMHVGAP